MNVIRPNLLPVWASERRASFVRRRGWAVTVLSAASLLLIGAALAPRRTIDLDELARERDRMRKSIETLTVAISDQKQRQSVLNQQIELSRQASTRLGWSSLIVEVWRATQTDTLLDVFAVSPVETGSESSIIYEVRLEGTQRTGSVDDFALRLQSSDLFSSVRVLSTQRSENAGDGHAQRFTIRCTIESRVGGGEK